MDVKIYKDIKKKIKMASFEKNLQHIHLTWHRYALKSITISARRGYYKYAY